MKLERKQRQENSPISPVYLPYISPYLPLISRQVKLERKQRHENSKTGALFYKLAGGGPDTSALDAVVSGS